MTQVARQLRREATPAEQALWEALRNRGCGGWKINRQVVVGRFVLDFYCPAARLAIEVDGPIHQNAEALAHDRARDDILQHEFQIQTFRLTNDEVLTGSPAALRERLIEALAQAATEAPPWESRPARRR